MEITKEIKNELFKRNEIFGVVEAEKNPNFEEIRKEIAEKVGKPEENIDVYNIKGAFGSNKFNIDAYVYDSKEDLDKAVQKTQKQRKAEAETAKKVVETPAEEASAPVEEVKEKPAETENPAEEVKAEGAPTEEKTPEEKPAEAPVETPAEDKPEEEAKAVREEKQGAEEAKEH